MKRYKRNDLRDLLATLLAAATVAGAILLTRYYGDHVKAWAGLSIQAVLALGFLLALGGLGAFLAERIPSKLPGESFLSGYVIALGVAVGLVAAGYFVSLADTPRRPEPWPQNYAQIFDDLAAMFGEAWKVLVALLGFYKGGREMLNVLKARQSAQP